MTAQRDVTSPQFLKAERLKFFEAFTSPCLYQQLSKSFNLHQKEIWLVVWAPFPFPLHGALMLDPRLKSVFRQRHNRFSVYSCSKSLSLISTECSAFPVYPSSPSSARLGESPDGSRMETTSIVSLEDGASGHQEPMANFTRPSSGFLCNICDREFSRRSDLRRHRKSKHLRSVGYICQVSSLCPRAKRPFMRKDNRDEHQKRVHKVGIAEMRQ